MTTEIANTKPTQITITEWDAMRQQAEAYVKSGLLPMAINTPEKALVIMQKGKELGIPPMEAMSSINVIQGKPSVSPQLMLALARRTKELENFSIEKTDKQATVKVKRKGQNEVVIVFTIEMAAQMGLSTKENWKKMPGIMLQWRAVAENLRLTFPDAISGLYTYDEMGAEVDADGNLAQTITTRGTVQMPKALDTTIENKKEEKRT